MIRKLTSVFIGLGPGAGLGQVNGQVKHRGGQICEGSEFLMIETIILLGGPQHPL